MPDMPDIADRECPITYMPMKLPVITNGGVTYEFTAIAKHIIKSIDKACPVSTQPINTLILNRAIRLNSIVLSDDECSNDEYVLNNHPV